MDSGCHWGGCPCHTSKLDQTGVKARSVVSRSLIIPGSALTLTSKSEDKIDFHPGKSKTVQDEHLIMWTSSLGVGQKPKIITRLSRWMHL